VSFIPISVLFAHSWEAFAVWRTYELATSAMYIYSNIIELKGYELRLEICAENTYRKYRYTISELSHPFRSCRNNRKQHSTARNHIRTHAKSALDIELEPRPQNAEEQTRHHENHEDSDCNDISIPAFLIVNTPPLSRLPYLALELPARSFRQLVQYPRIVLMHIPRTREQACEILWWNRRIRRRRTRYAPILCSRTGLNFR
jgi:hypothetical protein